MSAEGDGQDGSDELAVIGISFGNSNSSIAYTTGDGKAEVIANEEGDRQIPSVLAYVDGEEFHGTQAKSQLVRNSKNTVTSFRDFIGKTFDAIDPTPCHASAHPLKNDSTIAFSIDDAASGSPNEVSVSEVTTRHIRRLVSSASDFLGRKVNAAVISVPTNFSEDQKKALVSAAQAADIQVLQTISEPTAAVLAYDARPEAKQEDKILVVADFGGSRSDIAVVASRGGMYSVLSTIHNYETAGNQLDTVLVDHFAKEFLKKHKSATDPRSEARSLAKLKLEAEKTKKALSIGGNAALSIESLIGGLDFSSTINRTRYEMLATKVFGSLTRLISEAIQKAELDILDVDEVILSGGTSHTPRLANNIASLFNDPSNKRSTPTTVLAPALSTTAIDPSTLAARGAAIQASLVSGYDLQDIEQNTHPMCTVTPHLSRAVGVMLISENADKGVFFPVIERETAVPCRRVGLLPVPSPTSDAGSEVFLKVCEAVPKVKETQLPKEKKAEKSKPADSDADSDDDDEDDDEPETSRESIWQPTNTLAELAVHSVKKGSKIEVTIDITADLTVTLTARPVSKKGVTASGGVRGKLEAGSGKASAQTNGTAS